jgi:hypothetical protein
VPKSLLDGYAGQPLIKKLGIKTNLTQQIVRQAGLAVGLVDYKICAIDATWSGLLFTRRKVK